MRAEEWFTKNINDGEPLDTKLLMFEVCELDRIMCPGLSDKQHFVLAVPNSPNLAPAEVQIPQYMILEKLVSQNVQS